MVQIRLSGGDKRGCAGCERGLVAGVLFIYFILRHGARKPRSNIMKENKLKSKSKTSERNFTLLHETPSARECQGSKHLAE
jgi:hypothetical protein